MPNIDQWLADAAAIAADPATKQLITDIATGEGGAAKIEKAGFDLLAILTHVVTGATQATPAS